MPFLRRTALARSRCFSGSQRTQVSGVFSPLRRVSQTPGARSLRTHFRDGSGMQLPSPGYPQQVSVARPGDQVARPGRDPPHAPGPHPAALTQLGLNGRRARHHVRSSLLHNRRGAFSQPGDSAAASPEGQPHRARCAVRGPARPGSRGRRPHPGRAGLSARHGPATARRDAQPRLSVFGAWAGREAVSSEQDGGAQAPAAAAQNFRPRLLWAGTIVPHPGGLGSFSSGFWDALWYL